MSSAKINGLTWLAIVVSSGLGAVDEPLAGLCFGIATLIAIYAPEGTFQ